MKQKRFLSMLVLLVAVATGAWADTTVTWTVSDMTDLFIDFEEGSAAHNTIKGITVTASSGGNGAWQGNNISMDEGSTTITFTSSVGNIKSIAITAQSIYSYGDTPSGWTMPDYKNLSWSGDASPTVSMTLSDWSEFSNISEIVFTIGPAAPVTTYAITLAEGTEDFGNWTVPAEAAEGAEVTATYSGDRKVKSVKAVKKAASGPEVTTFSELQTALSAGKDVKLMNDIVCTAEIEITSGALTIDGNGKTLNTTSAIRAFKVGSSATVAFKNLTLTGFVSGGSPAINNNGGTIVLDGCTISNCHVSGGQGGGAIENKGGGKLYAINTTFSGNYSGEIGGAINNYGGSLYMSGCTFTNNYTTSSNAFYGGAIGINGGSEIRLINCSFSGNKYGTAAGTNDIGVYSKPTNDNYTIAGCTGATIASAAGDITTIASGTATLDYSDLSNISFTYTPITVTWNGNDITGSGTSFTKDGVTITADDIEFNDKNFYGPGTFTTTRGNFTKIEVTTEGWYASGTGWSGKTWTGNASNVSFSGEIMGYGGDNLKFVFTIEPTTN